MRQEYHIEGLTTQQILSKWKDHQITEGNHLVCKGVCLDKYLLVEDLIKFLEVSILDVEEAQGNEFDRGYATALSVFKDWIVDNVLSSDSEPKGSTHNKDLEVSAGGNKMEVKEVNGRLIIELGNHGYLMFEPLATINDNQRYSITFKINDATVVTRRMLSSGVDIKKMFEYELVCAIDSMKQTLNDIQKEIRTVENKTQTNP